MGTCWPELEGLEVGEDLGVQVVGCRGELCLFEGAQTPISPGPPPVHLMELPIHGFGVTRDETLSSQGWSSAGGTEVAKGGWGGQRGSPLIANLYLILKRLMVRKRKTSSTA